MSLQTRLGALITAIGADIKSLKNAYTASESWHELGATGEPTLQSGWVNFGVSTHETAAYRKTVTGDVELKGLIGAGTTIASANPAFTLPVGYRPAKIEHFSAVGGGQYGQIQVKPDGKVIIDNGNNAYVSLRNVRFSVGPGQIALAAPTLLTALPGGTPVNAQEAYVQTAAMKAADCPPYHIRYDSSIVDGYAWVVQNPHPYQSFTDARTDTTITATSFTSSPMALETLTTPFSGIYDLDWLASGKMVTGNTATYFGVARTNTMMDELLIQLDFVQQNNLPWSRHKRQTLLSGDVIQGRARADLLSGTPTVQARRLQMTPLRLAG